MTDPMTPKEVKTTVQDQLQKSDFSWIRRDWVVVGVLAVVLSVLSTVNIIILRGVERSIEQSDLIAECLTPGTRCSNFRAENEAQEREYLEGLMRSTSICVLHASRAAQGQSIEALDRAYDQCVEGSTPSTTTTTR